MNDFIASLLGDWSTQINVWSSMLKLFLTIVFTAIIGSERATKRHDAGLRTFILVGLTANIAAILDLYILKDLGASFSLLTAAIMIGLAIIGSNTILFSSKNQLKGLTTSVSLWATGIVSAVMGFGLYSLAIIGYVVLILIIAIFPNMEKRFKNKSKRIELHIELESRSCLREFITTVRKLGFQISEIEINPAYANSGLGVYSVVLKMQTENLRKKTHKELIEALSSITCVSYIEEIT